MKSLPKLAPGLKAWIDNVIVPDGGKAAIAVQEDRQLALAEEMLELLVTVDTDVFLPKDLVDELSAKDAWGEHLANQKNEKAKQSAVGRFFSPFRLISREHTSKGTKYQRSEAIEVPRGHLPAVDPLPSSVIASPSDITATKQAGWRNDTSEKQVSLDWQNTSGKEVVSDVANDTCEKHVSSPQSIEPKVDVATCDALTLQSQGNRP